MRRFLPILVLSSLLLSACGSKPQLKPHVSGNGPISFYSNPQAGQSFWLVSHRAPKRGNWYHIETVEVSFELNGNQQVDLERVTLGGMNAAKSVVLHATARTYASRAPLVVVTGSCLKKNKRQPRCLRAVKLGRSRYATAQADVWVKKASQLTPGLTQPNFFSLLPPLSKVSINRYTNYGLYLEVATPLKAKGKSGWDKITLFYRSGEHHHHAQLTQPYRVSCQKVRGGLQRCTQTF